MTAIRRDPTVYIILLNWNQWRLTVACMESLARLRYGSFHVVVVDNGSRDDSVARIEDWLARRLRDSSIPGSFTLVPLPANIGFSGGNNVGIDRALAGGAEYVWVLNNDTVCDPDALAALVRCSGDAGGALVSSNVVMMDEPTKPWYQGGRFNPVFATAKHSTHEDFVAGGRYRFLTGCSLLIPRAALERVGRLDDRFFVYFEDVDYCVRAEALGFPLCVAMDSLVLHHASGTNGLQSDFSYRTNTRSAVLFTAKHFPLFLPTALAHRLLKAIALCLLGRVSQGRAVAVGAALGLGASVLISARRFRERWAGASAAAR